MSAKPITFEADPDKPGFVRFRIAGARTWRSLPWAVANSVNADIYTACKDAAAMETEAKRTAKPARI
tara:strand:+ start:887 stop:1087 length:201 start_codon:yes stop_codon:yes gene_type:complete